MIKKYISEEIVFHDILQSENIFQKSFKLDEILNHILHLSSFSHFNSIWRVPFMSFHEKHAFEVFHSNKHKCMNT